MAEIDPVCVIHGKRRSEHECLYCCLCFKDLAPEKCSYLPNGTQVDVCVPCAEAEQAVLIDLARRYTACKARRRAQEGSVILPGPEPEEQK